MYRAVFGALIIYYLIISSLPHYSQFSHYLCAAQHPVAGSRLLCSAEPDLLCVSGEHTAGSRGCPGTGKA